jgi:hypothetical protein
MITNHTIAWRAAIATALLAAAPAVLAAKGGDVAACGTKAEPELKTGTENTLLEVKEGMCTVKAGVYTFGKIEIQEGATLRFSDAIIDLTAKSIVVKKGGAMITATAIGTSDIGNKLVVRLKDDRPPGSTSTPDDCSAINKGIAVMSGARLNLAGRRGVAPDDGRSASIGGANPGSVSWTYLAAPAGPVKYQTTTAKIGSPVDAGGQLVIKVPLDVTKDWLPGDWIVVGTTSFSPFESEFVRIAPSAGPNDKPLTFSGGVTTIKLDPATPLRQYHFGSADPGRPSVNNASAGATTNYGVDERA